ncbi:ornithine carbamoyltransferase [Candidatus Endolissoclinum faulkneri L2]|uniref:Ornithine carbamoyltransferase n=1 Tax=Candidatus Endolissoclinum faulkneri L2 TaxID=1193729 RepID=K7ZCN2_9PROT|nr:ornithine carbamoyltransferase [Candidatus Endolissoclinum faulkneri]AFX98746.1 ornithine carbamoyltransferase [Candidatus Endolissoclinum faulkneri L2]
MKHFLDLDQIDSSILREIIEQAKGFKLADRLTERPLDGKILALIFEKPSTRTRVSFEAGMKRLGGEVIMLNSSDLQLSRGETVSDTAKVLSGYVDCIMMRTLLESRLVELAENSTVPVINGLTNRSHPCQLMADVMTFEEHCGSIKDKVIAWCGDGNNMATSWIQAAVQFDFVLRIACPPDLMPSQNLIDWANHKGGRVYVNHDPSIAVFDADAVVTDTWVSMGDLDSNRHDLLVNYRVDDRLMAKAKSNSVFMHCMPANRGKDVTAGVIDGPQSIVFNEAENRMYSQMAILCWCLSETG